MTHQPLHPRLSLRTEEKAPGQDQILTPAAAAFLVELADLAMERRERLIEARRIRRQEISNGHNPEFLPETAHIREDPTWQVPPPAPGLEDRRVEITGPTDAKMTINALNSGARVWLADQEDANTPLWHNVIGGQWNLYRAIRGELEYTSPEGKEYRVTSERTPTIMLRPRGWHLMEEHLLLDGKPIPGGIVDFGLYLFHNAKELVARGRGPYFYIPKLESHREARLWNRVFVRAQELLGLPQGTIRVTVLIETITAAFEMEEILYELRQHSAGLNAGRWDYIFSVIKNFKERGPRFVLPDRSQIQMTVPFMRAYTEQLVRACHRRGAHAIGGMAAFIPNRRDPEVTERALAQVRADKQREVADGFDGSWVAHPDLVSICEEVFTATLGSEPNQIGRTRQDVRPCDHALIDFRIPGATVTEQGVRVNVEVGIRYIESWLRGVGAAGINNLMEDAATAEISRSQLWQWVHAGVRCAAGPTVTREWIGEIIEEEFAKLQRFDGDRFDDARELFTEVALGEKYATWLTVPAYQRFMAPAQDTVAV